jgi:hypothetical protein
MLNRKNIFLATLTAMVSLFSVSAMAMGSAPAHDHQDPVQGCEKSVAFSCQFSGNSDSNKSTGWSQNCSVEGNYVEHHDANLKHMDEHFKVSCDGAMGEDGHQSSSVVYDGSLNHAHDPFDGAFNGSEDSAPHIVMQLPSDEHADSFSADMNYNQDGYNYDIPGNCHFVHDAL